MKRKVLVFAFCSVKGGVGKSALAVLSAKALTQRGIGTVVLDCDLLGTSLADALPLLAPGMQPNTWYTHEETVLLRDRRAVQSTYDDLGEPPPLFLNDLLSKANGLGTPLSRADVGFWKHQGLDEGPWFLPSSSIHGHVNVALQAIYADGGETWANHLGAVLRTIVVEYPDIRAIVLDLPPGIYAFSQEVLGLLVRLKHPQEGPSEPLSDLLEVATWVPKPFLVTSQNRGDLWASLEAWSQLNYYDFGLVPVINRVTEAPRRLVGSVRHRFANTIYKHDAPEKKWVVVSEDAQLIPLFGEKGIDQVMLPPDFLPVLDRAVKEISS